MFLEMVADSALELSTKRLFILDVYEFKYRLNTLLLIYIIQERQLVILMALPSYYQANHFAYSCNFTSVYDIKWHA